MCPLTDPLSDEPVPAFMQCSKWVAMRRVSSSVDRITERVLWVGRRRAFCRIASGV